MRKILIILLFLPLFSFGQENPYQYFKLNNGTVSFEKVYEVKDTTVDIERLLTLNIPKIKNIRDYNKTGEIITARIGEAEIDYKRYGGKWANTWLYVIHPMYADVIIVWKDRKYRVTVSNIIFIPYGSRFSLNFSEDMLKKKGTMFDTKEIVVRSSKYVESTLSEMFEIKEINDNW